MHIWVRPKPHIHKEYGPRFPPSLHISYTMDCPVVLIGRDAISGCYDQWVRQYQKVNQRYFTSFYKTKLQRLVNFSHTHTFPLDILSSSVDVELGGVLLLCIQYVLPERLRIPCLLVSPFSLCNRKKKKLPFKSLITYSVKQINVAIGQNNIIFSKTSLIRI
jgi:hypothetical protein